MKEKDIINTIKALINELDIEKSLSIRQLLSMQISELALKLSKLNKI